MLRRNIIKYAAGTPFASLFGYNPVLSRAFSAAGNAVAITVEKPGYPVEEYTYGQLQSDVIALANDIVKRQKRSSTHENNGVPAFLQQPKETDVRGLYRCDSTSMSQKGLRYSCDVLRDDGRYNVAVLLQPSYEYVVTLLALWSLNLMAVPLCPQHKYDGEMTHMLEHSASRLLLTERALLEHKLPKAYSVLPGAASTVVGHEADAITASTYHIRSVIDLADWISEEHRRRSDRCNDSRTELMEPVRERKPLRSAEDVIERIKEEKKLAVEREATMREEAVFDEFLKTQSSALSKDPSAPLMFNDVSELNDVFRRRWNGEGPYCPGENDDCLMIYTSGTTAKPKGVVHTHASLGNQVCTLQEAWRWTPTDSILNVLPLHHVHGLVNILLCSLASGARCVFTPFDNPLRVAKRLDRGDISLMMGVPTIYTKLADAVASMSPIERTGWKKAVSQQIRLMVSGSAALPVPVLNRFHELSGHTLLERYGMTEVGMALSQLYTPVSSRLPGTVGPPLPGTETMVLQGEDDASQKGEERDTTTTSSASSLYSKSGRLALRSESIFDRYWNNPSATKADIKVHPTSGEYYFDTGDTVGVIPVRSSLSNNANVSSVETTTVEHYAILGRTSVDIIKCRGYKISALEIEAALLSDKDAIEEVAVVGVPHATLGEEIVAVVKPKQRWLSDNTIQNKGEEGHQGLLKAIASQLLAPYKVPSRFVLVDQIPRNAMGKINKKELKKTLGLVR